MAVTPRVSVVTPFYNTAPYLAECIESVLAQTLTEFEYLLVNNQSSDGSRDIAARYAATDSRIRLLDNPAHVGQVENYNGALAQISGVSRWVKLIQADDALFPDCLARMVAVGERDSNIGLVGSYYLKGDFPAGGGIPRDTWRVPGRDLARRMLLTDLFPIGSPSAQMYRADIVRERRPFYALGRYHEDTEAAYEILLRYDFGFVHQVLAFLRTENVSIMSGVHGFNPGKLDHLIAFERYGRELLADEEYEAVKEWEWGSYMGFLGRSLFLRRGEDFWKYHLKGLAMIDKKLRRRDVMWHGLREIARSAVTPVASARKVFSAFQRRRTPRPR